MKPVPCLFMLGFAGLCGGQSQQPKPQNATTAVLRAFDDHNIVMLGEGHGLKQQYDWLRELVSTPEFADRVDDIVMEGGNSLYQKSVDRYIAGEDIPFAEAEQALRNDLNRIGPPFPTEAPFYRAVREANLRRRGKHQVRILLASPPGDWETVKDHEELDSLVGDRELWYARAVKEEVLDKKRRALLIMGGSHFLRHERPWTTIEQQLRTAGARTYLIVFGTPYDLDKRFDAWPLPAIVELQGNWVGDLPAAFMFYWESHLPKKLGDTADALLYLGPRDVLRILSMTRAELELEGPAFRKELDRRTMIQMGLTLDLLPGDMQINDTPEHPLPPREPSR